jgi:hypothetical protein
LVVLVSNVATTSGGGEGGRGDGGAGEGGAGDGGAGEGDSWADATGIRIPRMTNIMVLMGDNVITLLVGSDSFYLVLFLSE